MPYYHVVFTLPPAVAKVVWQNRHVGYTLLFQAVQQTVATVAADPKHLGAQVGLLAVLHTWGQDLHYHPHVHGVATGGGLACDRAGRSLAPPHWRSCRPGFFLPVRVLSRVYRGKYLAGLRKLSGGPADLPRRAGGVGGAGRPSRPGWGSNTGRTGWFMPRSRLGVRRWC